MKKTTITTLALASMFIGVPAYGQTVTTQDISVQLQSSLEASAPVVVYFEFDKAHLTTDTKSILDQQVIWLQTNPDAKVDLAGHTDAVGSNEYNFNLAMRRARAVESYMLENGVRAVQMRSVVSQGEDNLAVTTQKRERLNRRVSTSVTGLVEIVAVAPALPLPPPVVTPPARRTYAEDRPPNCNGRSRTSLLALADAGQIRTELQTRLDTAINVYKSDASVVSTNSTYNLAAFTKAECGIAIGYTKNSIIDERSVSNCDCYSDLLAVDTF